MHSIVAKTADSSCSSQFESGMPFRLQNHVLALCKICSMLAQYAHERKYFWFFYRRYFFATAIARSANASLRLNLASSMTPIIYQLERLI